MNRTDKIENSLFYHVYNRGNNKMQIFRDDSDYMAFIKKMNFLSQKLSVFILAYALLPNHYHLLVSQENNGGISKIMGSLATSAAKRYNLKYAHIGHLFQGPFRYVPIYEDTIYHTACYIHLNPVRAKLVKKPEEWKYSNYPEILSRRFPSTLERTLLKETFVQEEYLSFVQQILKEETEDAEFWKKFKARINGSFPQKYNFEEENLLS